MKLDDFEFADSEILDINLGTDFIEIRIREAYNLTLREYVDNLIIEFADSINIATHKHMQDGSIEINSDLKDSLPKIISSFEHGDNEVVISGSSKSNTDWYDTLIKFERYRIMLKRSKD
ncbi:hypothetical protein [Deinococcus knuensis]|uniref:Uncharacterized protein n=1 Tax=Deinococcus knuensis TaxID=1837380 RepID=A0ABQ2SCS2_9DEIO|nr:hypothetical protein [Deinococcus knuensis]GGS14203.1 hypothetical protein GCM10008961_01800 [Deinococcus knuensis]